MESSLISIGIVGVVIGFLIGYFFVKSKLSALSKEIELLKSNNQKLENEFDTLDQNKKSEISEVSKLNLELEKQISEYKNENKHLTEKLEAKDKEQKENEGYLRTQFENLSTRMLEESTKKLEEKNQKNLDNILNPLKIRIEEFKKTVEDSHKEGLQDSATLRTELKNLLDLNKVITEETNNLTKALKGESKTQGGWGEMILDSILEKSGLIEGEQYERQSSITNDEGKRLQPDVILNLPNERYLIIDSKVSLTAYSNYINSEDELIKNGFIKEHVKSVKNHVKDLGSKEYENLHQSKSLDFVLMFMPIEAAFVIAMKESPDIFNEAFNKGIVIVSPTTLLATAKTIESIWKQEHRSQNAEDIAKRGASLYDKFVGFVDSIEDIGKSISKSQEHYDEAVKRLSTGRGNLIRQAEQLKELGISTKKQLPDKFNNDEIEE